MARRRRGHPRRRTDHGRAPPGGAKQASPRAWPSGAVTGGSERDPRAGRRRRAADPPGAVDQPQRARVRRAHRRRPAPRPSPRPPRTGPRSWCSTSDCPDMDGTEVIARPSRLDERARSWCSPAARTPRTRSTPSTPAPTTTSPSPSAWTSCWPGCVPWCDAPATSGEEQAVVDAGEVAVDLARASVVRAGAEVRLTPTEWHLLEVLVRHPGRAAEPATAPGRGLGAGLRDGPRQPAPLHGQLRRKLEPDPARPRHLVTEPGMGYRFEP